MNKRKGITGAAVLVILIAAVAAAAVHFMGDSSKELSPDTVKIGKSTYVQLNPGDEMDASAWNQMSVTVNDREYRDEAMVYGNVTLGNTVNELKKVYQIDETTATINAEIPTEEHDGTTDIIEIPYSDSFFEKYEGEYLDAVIAIGFKKTEGGGEEADTDLVAGKWHQTSRDEIENADILYIFDINGMPEEAVKQGEIIEIRVIYNNIEG